MLARLASLIIGLFTLALAGPVLAQDEPGGATAEWLASRDSCSASNRAACDRAVELAAQLFERTDRDVATTWMKACMAGDMDRCEIGYRRFRNTSLEGDEHPISHMFARISCYFGMYDLCRPWEDFETTDPTKRAIVMADMCMQGASPNTCYEALAFFKNEKGFYNAITYDLSETLCERYESGSACRVWAQALEANWGSRRAWKYHKIACREGLQASCPDAARLKKRVDYLNRQQQAADEARMRAQIATQRGSTWRSQAYNAGYTSPGRVRQPITPFGSKPREIENWRRYERALCMGNPVNKYC